MSSEKFIKNNLALVTLIAASLVVFLSLSVRQVFGMFFMDFNIDLGITNTEFGLAIGIQMLVGDYQDLYLEQLQINMVAIKLLALHLYFISWEYIFYTQDLIQEFIFKFV